MKIGRDLPNQRPMCTRASAEKVPAGQSASVACAEPTSSRRYVIDGLPRVESCSPADADLVDGDARGGRPQRGGAGAAAASHSTGTPASIRRGRLARPNENDVDALARAGGRFFARSTLSSSLPVVRGRRPRAANPSRPAVAGPAPGARSHGLPLGCDRARARRVSVGTAETTRFASARGRRRRRADGAVVARAACVGTTRELSDGRSSRLARFAAARRARLCGNRPVSFGAALWTATSGPRSETLELGQIDVDSTRFSTSALLSSSSRRRAHATRVKTVHIRTR